MLLVAALWRLSSGPIPLDALTPFVEEAIRPPDGDFEVRVGQTELRFGGGRVVTFALVDVAITTPSGGIALETPEIDVDFSLAALVLHGIIAPTRLQAAVNQLVLIRDVDGSIGLQGGSPGRTEADAGAGLDLKLLAEDLLRKPDPARPLTYLDRVTITGERLILEDRADDRRIEARRGALELVRDERVDATLVFELPREDRIVRVRASGNFDGARLAFRARARDLKPADLGPYLDLPELAGLDVLLNTQIASAVDLDGTLRPIAFEIASSGGTVDLSNHFIDPLPLERLHLEGTLAGDLTRVRIDSLDLGVLGATLSGRGSASFENGELAVQARAQAKNVQVADLDRLWPTSAGQQAREWAIPNVRAGVVTDGEIAIDIRPGDLDQMPIPRTMVSGRFAYEDLGVRYFEGFPPIEGIDGVAHFDGWVLAFEGGGGTAGGLKLNEGKVAITGMTVPGKYATPLHVQADLAGPVADALDLLDREPLGFPTRLGIDPAKTTGSVTVRLQLSMPLYKDVGADALEVDAEADLANVDIDQLFGQVDVRDGELALSILHGAMTLEGSATVSEQPLTLSLREDFTGEAEEVRRYRVQTDLGPADLERLGVPGPLPFGFDGSVALDLAGVESANGSTQIGVKLDLAKAALALPMAGWEKARGAPGTTDVEIRLPSEGAIEIENLLIEAPDLRVDASLRLGREPFALERADLNKVVIGDQRFGGRLINEDDLLQVAIRGEQLALDPLLDAFEAGEGGEQENDAAPMPLSLDVAVDQLTLHGQSANEVQLTANRTIQGWRNAVLTGVLASGSRVDARLTAVGDKQTATVVTDDAGGLIELLTERRPIAGGALRLDGELRRQPDLRFKGELTIDDFTLDQAPTLARVLTLLSAKGIGDVMTGRKLAMTRLELPFRWTPGRLVLEPGRTWGSGLGLTTEGSVDLEADTVDLKGTVLPAYGLNWAIGKIPVLGDFLAGAKGEGAFAATYRITGPFEQPEVDVNPLAVLAPGFLRELFEGKSKPPEMPQDPDLSR